MTTFVEVEERRGFRGWMMAMYLKDDKKLLLESYQKSEEQT